VSSDPFNTQIANFNLVAHTIERHQCFTCAWLQVKGLLKDDKVDLLVDPDLKDNYEYKEVEELIQVSLL